MVESTISLWPLMVTFFLGGILTEAGKSFFTSLKQHAKHGKKYLERQVKRRGGRA